MSFYEQISKYYDDIFPVGTSQLEFIRKVAGDPPARILDVACGSGGYTVELAKSGYEMTAVDLEEEMIEKARLKAVREGVEPRILQCDMKELRSKLSGRFDCIFCIGNSIVHLGSLHEIQEAVKQMAGLLGEGGKLVLQIINYDRIIKYNITELPAIEDKSKGLSFIRKYGYDKAQNVVNFDTTLIIHNGGVSEKFVNSIPLFPVMSEDMHRIMAGAGFEKIEFYGDFDGSGYDDKSYMLVVKGIK